MTDRLTVRLVVATLGLVALLTIAGGFWLAHDDKGIPDALIALGSSSVGAIAALLARTSSAPTVTVADDDTP